MRLDGGSGPAATVAVATEVAAEVKEAAAEVVTAAEAMEVAVVEATEEEEKAVDYPPCDGTVTPVACGPDRSYVA